MNRVIVITVIVITVIVITLNLGLIRIKCWQLFVSPTRIAPCRERGKSIGILDVR